MEDEIYVVVAENDQPIDFGNLTYTDDKGPLVFEQYTRRASLEIVKVKKKNLETRYGKCRIAKLVFIDEGE